MSEYVKLRSKPLVPYSEGISGESDIYLKISEIAAATEDNYGALSYYYAILSNGKDWTITEDSYKLLLKVIENR